VPAFRYSVSPFLYEPVRKPSQNALNEPDPILQGSNHDTRCAACSREIHGLAWHVVGRPELDFCTRRCLNAGAVR